MCRKLIFQVSFVLALWLVSNCYGVVVGDFEDGLDGWAARDATLSLSTTGATLGTQAMQVDSPGGWHLNTLLDVRFYRDLLGTPGTLITADVTAFDADMTTTLMQVEMVINGQDNDDNGVNNNIGWQGLGLQAVALDGLPHTYTWALPETLTSAIALTDGNIAWFELALASNLDEASVTKFYIDNIQLISNWSPSPSVVFGDWENDMDGWVLAPDLEGTTVEYSDTNGVTLNDYSLRMYVPGSEYQKTIYLNLLTDPELLEAFRNGKVFQMDVTRLAAEWPGDIGWGGIIHLVVNAGGDGWILWEGEGMGFWMPDQGDSTQTLEWDYSSYLAQIDFDNVWWLELFICPNCGGSTSGVYYFDNLQIPMRTKASEPNPPDGAEGVPRELNLSWEPGESAFTHNVYFSTDFDAVAIANEVNHTDVTFTSVEVSSYDPGILDLETTYYWRIDEVNDLNPSSPWAGGVWSFTTGNFLVVDDFEDYNDYEPYRIFDTWIDGWGITTNGSTIGYPQPEFSMGEHFVEINIVNRGNQSMPYFYDNDMKYSEAERVISGSKCDWTRENVKELSLWFRGYPAYIDGFTEEPVGTYTITASGTDITGTSDEFHFAYKMLSGPGSITVRVLSVDNTDPWAKAGVMIRETLEPGSKHALACVTPDNGIAFEYRLTTGSGSFSTNQSGVAAPHWVKLERDVGGNFIVYHSADGSAWVPIEGAPRQSIQMSANVYIGLAVTSHNTDATCEAVFSNVSFTGNVSQEPWMDQDIGILSNAAEQMYLVLNGSAVIYHDDPNASQISEWTEWKIDLQEFADQGVDLTNVESIGIGFGQRNNPQAGGSGLVFFDDIRLYRPALQGPETIP